jgi:hypothetical protein
VLSGRAASREFVIDDNPQRWPLAGRGCLGPRWLRNAFREQLTHVAVFLKALAEFRSDAVARIGERQVEADEKVARLLEQHDARPDADVSASVGAIAWADRRRTDAAGIERGEIVSLSIINVTRMLCALFPVFLGFRAKSVDLTYWVLCAPCSAAISDLALIRSHSRLHICAQRFVLCTRALSHLRCEAAA